MEENDILVSILSSQQELRKEIVYMNSNVTRMHEKNVSEIVLQGKNLLMLDSEIRVLSNKLDNYHYKVDEHEQLLRGDIKNLGKDGLISTTTENKNSIKLLREEMGNEIKNLRGTFAIVWTAIITSANVIWNIVNSKIHL